MLRAGWIMLLFLIGFVSPSFADWQFTKWGMSPAQVTAASGGRTVRKWLTPEAELDLHAGASVVAGSDIVWRCRGVSSDCPGTLPN